MKRSLVLDFCLESTIPGVLAAYDVENNEELKKEKLIKAVLHKAKTDANRGTRSAPVGFIGNVGGRLFAEKRLCDILKDENGADLSSNTLISTLQKMKGAPSHAFIQKFVNMTLKYIIVLQELKDGIPGIYVDEKQCDCPIDSVIVDCVNKRRKKQFLCWTKQGQSEYYEIQEVIKSKYEIPLEYDFVHWRSPK